jgi:hypothetical protein
MIDYPNYHNDGGNIFLLGDNPGLMGTRILIRTRGKGIDAVTFINLISPEELNGPALIERKAAGGGVLLVTLIGQVLSQGDLTRMCWRIIIEIATDYKTSCA